jgi:hypothetical protein
LHFKTDFDYTNFSLLCTRTGHQVRRLPSSACASTPSADLSSSSVSFRGYSNTTVVQQILSGIASGSIPISTAGGYNVTAALCSFSVALAVVTPLTPQSGGGVFPPPAPPKTPFTKTGGFAALITILVLAAVGGAGFAYYYKVIPRMLRLNTFAWAGFENA